MANNAFDRTNFGLRERPVSSDYNHNMSQSDRALRDTLMRLMSARSLTSAAGVPYTGFIGDGFRVVPSSPIGLSVQLTAGLGFFYDPISVPTDLGADDLEGVDDRSAYKPMLLTAPQAFAVPAAPGTGNSRIDIIEARYSRQLTDPQTRRQLDASSKQFNDHVFNKTLTFALDGVTGLVNNPDQSVAALSYKVGTPAATGTEIEPTVSAGYVQIARINVGPNVTTIDRDVLVDRRALLHPGGVVPFNGVWRMQWNSGSPIVTTHSVTNPPGVHVAIQPLTSSGRGVAEVYAVGGQIIGGSMVVTGMANMDPSLTDRFAISFQALQSLGDAVNNPVRQVNAFGQPNLLAATPSISVGIGSTMCVGRLLSRFVTNTGASNNTDASLEDMMIQVSGALRYT